MHHKEENKDNVKYTYHYTQYGLCREIWQDVTLDFHKCIIYCQKWIIPRAWDNLEDSMICNIAADFETKDGQRRRGNEWI